jgi:hypothetical protein
MKINPLGIILCGLLVFYLFLSPDLFTPGTSSTAGY